MPTRLTAEQATEELQRRFEAARVAMTPEAIADGHAWQLKVLRCTAAAILLMCSRRAGKSRVACGMLALTAMATAGCSSLYLALTKGQAEKIFRKHWKPLLRKFKVPCSHAGTVTTFPNGSQVVFGGTDDMRTVTHLLGDSMAAGLAFLDEQQSDPGLLESIAKDVLSPMLDETTATLTIPGRLAIGGTVPDRPVGYFWKLWEESYDDIADKPRAGAHWAAFTWSRFENPHETANEWHLENYLKRYKLERADPIVQRNWFGKRVFTLDGTLVGALWDHRIHVIKPIKFPPGRYKFRSCFYTYADAIVLWIAVDTKGDYTVYRELHVTNHTVEMLAYRIRELEVDAKEWTTIGKRSHSRLTGPLGPKDTCWAKTGQVGQSASETMHYIGVSWFPADNNLQAAVDQVRQRLSKRSAHPTQVDANGKPAMTMPGVRFFRTCEQSIATIPNLPADKSDPEVPDKKSTTRNPYFALSSACMSRPIVPKQEKVDEDRLLGIPPRSKVATATRVGSRSAYPGGWR